jgi:competence protein ComEA
VHVAGAVTGPGVQRLRSGDRIVDAVSAAGGATADADLARVNLAAPLADGQQVYIPKVGEQPPVPLTPAAPPLGATGGAGTTAGATTAGAPTPGQPVDLNTATAEVLDTLPGVGPATATAILSYRDTNGPFTSVDQLLDVRGIGDAKLEQLRDLVTV